MSAIAQATPGLARAEKERLDAEAWQKEIDERNARHVAQTNHAVQIKLEKLARRDPMIAALLEEYAAFKATIATLREQHTALETKHADLSRDFQTQAKEKAALQIECDGLLDRAKQESARAAKAEADVQKLGQDLEAARSELGKLKAAKKA
jgi:chromosome segregation ATPase